MCHVVLPVTELFFPACNFSRIPEGLVRLNNKGYSCTFHSVFAPNDPQALAFVTLFLFSYQVITANLWLFLGSSPWLFWTPLWRRHRQKRLFCWSDCCLCWRLRHGRWVWPRCVWKSCSPFGAATADSLRILQFMDRMSNTTRLGQRLPRINVYQLPYIHRQETILVGGWG